MPFIKKKKVFKRGGRLPSEKRKAFYLQIKALFEEDDICYQKRKCQVSGMVAAFFLL